jgi:hypothetical protein
MGTENIKIAYIASSGRSGSTVLDLLLGAHPACWTLGEFHVLPWELRTNTKPCGCGEPVKHCSFWGPIVAELQDVLLHGSIDRFRDSYLGSRLLLFAEIPFLTSGSPWHRQKRKEHLDQYGRDNVRVLARVLGQARRVKGDQVAWLVDASKSIYRLLWLKAAGRFDIRAIHLVKDPRGFVYSMCKNERSVRRPWLVSKAALRWNIENHLFDRLFRAHFAKDEVLRIRYDDLAREPQVWLRRISTWLGVSPDDALPDKFRNENHGIAGNPARFETAGVRLDEKWRAELWPGTQLLVRAATSPLAARYGFPW